MLVPHELFKLEILVYTFINSILDLHDELKCGGWSRKRGWAEDKGIVSEGVKHDVLKSMWVV